VAYSLSLLQRVTVSDIQLDPFPHVVVEDALPGDLCDQLRASYPSLESQGVDASADNLRWSTKARDIDKIPNLSGLWTEMIQFHTSQAFLDQVLTLFAQPLRELFPTRFSSALALTQQRAVVRDHKNLSPGQLALDAQISGNTPVKTPGAPRGVHFDAPNALYGGLYYLRDDSDDSLGGDLQIWKWKDSYSHEKKSGEYREGVRLRHVELVKTVPYKANTFVFFINSIDSLHAVTTREATPHTRKFLNLLADSDQNFFDLKASPHLRIRNALRRRIFHTD
jgi:hypothetical protein